MKQLTLALLVLGIPSISFSQVDYSKAQTLNPYSRYEFKSGEEWREIKKQELLAQEQASRALQSHSVRSEPKGINYFNDSLPNPITSVKSKSGKASGGKYQHLAANQHRIGECWDKAAVTYKLDPWLLMAIAKTESSFNPNAVNAANRNKSVDYGMMQINSFWLPTLRKFNISKDDLFEPCTSIFVGAWIMAQNISRFGYNMDGIGAYNSPGNVTIRRNYASKVYKNYDVLVNDLYKKTNK